MRHHWLPWFLLPAACLAQQFTQRGYVETRAFIYPQAAPGDSGRAVADAIFRWEASYALSPGWRVFGSFDARADTHRQTARRWELSWWDRGLERPAFAVRRLSALYHRGPFNLELGKQPVRWGKADVLNPTDRFAPRDFLAVVDNEFLPVTAARLTWEARADTFDLVYSPRLTPSRIPLLTQRWVVLPPLPAGISWRDAGARFPGGPQMGARWNHTGAGYECSLSVYDGFQHLPLIGARLGAAGREVDLTRLYPKLRMYGADAAVPLRWLTLKGESAWFRPSHHEADEYVQYVVQVERQAGEWFLVGGYAGEKVTTRRRMPDFAPDRGLTRAFLGRAGYTIDARRSLAFEGAVRRNGDGVWLKFEYTQGFGTHWQATAGCTLVRGNPADFLGQYRRNSHATLALRYGF